MAREHITMFLGLNKAAFDKGIKSAEGMLAKLKGSFGSMAGLLGIGGLTIGVKSILDYADKIGTLAEEIGISTDFLQKFAWAAEQVGVSQEQALKGLERFTRYLDEARNGNKEYLETFQRLNVSLYDSEGRATSLESAIYQAADGFRNLSSEAEQVNLSMQLFGRTGGQVVVALKMGQEELRKLMDQADILSQKELEALDEADKGLKRLGNTLKVWFGGTADTLSEVVRWLTILGEKLGNLRDINPFSKPVQWVKELKQAFQASFDQFGMEAVQQDIKDEEKKRLNAQIEQARAELTRQEKEAQAAREIAEELAKKKAEEEKKTKAEQERYQAKVQAGQERMTNALEKLYDAEVRLAQAFNDRAKFGLEELANATPWTRQGARNVFQARQVIDMEGWAKRFVLEGNQAQADKLLDRAADIRRSLGALRSNEQDPLQAVKEAVQNSEDTLAQIESALMKEGILVRPVNGR